MVARTVIPFLFASALAARAVMIGTHAPADIHVGTNAVGAVRAGTNTLWTRTALLGWEHNTLTNLFNCGLAIQEATFVSCGATGSSSPGGADQIRVEVNGEKKQWALGPDNQWYLLNESGGWDSGYVLCDHVLAPGEVFLYWCRNAFVWVQPSPCGGE